MPATLDQALRSLTVEDDLPSVLPASHLRDARDIDRLSREPHLPLSYCKIFDEDLLYLFYGGIFYRRCGVPTKNAALLPLAFVFSPLVLKFVDRYYPFDTGAAHAGRYGDPWTEKLAPFKPRFRVLAAEDNHTPERMVYHFFRSNDGYLFGEPDMSCRDLPEPCPLLYDFLSADLTDRGVDQRYRRIEAHSKRTLSWEDLIWVGYPSVFELQMAQLKQRLVASPPIYYPYRSFPAAPPSEMAAILQDKAHDMAIGSYLEKGRQNS